MQSNSIQAIHSNPQFPAIQRPESAVFHSQSEPREVESKVIPIKTAAQPAKKTNPGYFIVYKIAPGYQNVKVSYEMASPGDFLNGRA